MPEGSRFEIVSREDFSDATFLLEIRHPMMARAARPGQFVIVMSHEHGERIPLTLADFQDEAQRLGPAGLELTVG